MGWRELIELEETKCKTSEWGPFPPPSQVLNFVSSLVWVSQILQTLCERVTLTYSKQLSSPFLSNYLTLSTLVNVNLIQARLPMN